MSMEENKYARGLLKVEQLNPQVTKEELSSKFEKFGKPLYVTICSGSDEQNNAYVRYEDHKNG